MKIAHWCLKNGSGLNKVAQEISDAETVLGYESIVLSSFHREDWDKGMDADIHVSHSHVPDAVRINGKGKVVWVGHGTPEHVFHTSVESGQQSGYGSSDSLMLVQWWMQHADALVTFWPRHQMIWQSMCDKGREVKCVPMGVNKKFWYPVESKGAYVGNPSVFSCENAHYIKWPMDLLIMWKWITDIVYDAHLHVIYLPKDQHKWWFPLVNRCGAHYKSYITSQTFPPESLRNAFVSTNYFTSFVRYGDFNRVSLEAKACGAKIIAWEGNLYADYWLQEGDQRRQADQFIQILKGEAKPRKTLEPPDISETANAMIDIYKDIL